MKLLGIVIAADPDHRHRRADLCVGQVSAFLSFRFVVRIAYLLNRLFFRLCRLIRSGGRVGHRTPIWVRSFCSRVGVAVECPVDVREGQEHRRLPISLPPHSSRHAYRTLVFSCCPCPWSSAPCPSIVLATVLSSDVVANDDVLCQHLFAQLVRSALAAK